MVDLVLFLTLTVLTGIGISVGYHRLFTHRAFRTSEPVKFVLGVLGSMAGQGPLVWWVKVHAQHHRFADQPGDPHSPVYPWTGWKGFLHSHFGWLFEPRPHLDPRYGMRGMAGFVDRTFWVWFSLGLAIPFVFGGWSGLFWGGLVRLVWVWNWTWFVNSWGHTWGRRDHDTPDNSRNSLVLALMTQGEGFHQNHHHQPGHAQFGPAWADGGYLFICLLEKLGFAWGVRR